MENVFLQGCPRAHLPVVWGGKAADAEGEGKKSVVAELTGQQRSLPAPPPPSPWLVFLVRGFLAEGVPSGGQAQEPTNLGSELGDTTTSLQTSGLLLSGPPHLPVLLWERRRARRSEVGGHTVGAAVVLKTRPGWGVQASRHGRWRPLAVHGPAFHHM